MKCQLTGLVAGVVVGEKTFNGVVSKDKNGSPVIERKMHVLDNDDPENFAPIKINFDEDQEETVKSLLREEATLNLTSHRYGKYTYYRFHSVVGLDQ